MERHSISYQMIQFPSRIPFVNNLTHIGDFDKGETKIFAEIKGVMLRFMTQECAKLRIP